MFTPATFTAALPAALAAICPAATYRDAPVILGHLAAESDYFTLDDAGVWFCVGNEDAYFPCDGPATATEAATALADMYTRWQMVYDPATGFSL